MLVRGTTSRFRQYPNLHFCLYCSNRCSSWPSEIAADRNPRVRDWSRWAAVGLRATHPCCEQRSLLDQVHLIDEFGALLGTRGGLLERDQHILAEPIPL